MRCESGLHGAQQPAAGAWSTFQNVAATRASSFPELTSDVRRYYATEKYFRYPQEPMDPLSVSASLIAVIGAAATVARSLEKLRTALRDASSDLCSLVNEVSDFRIVLDAIDVVLKEWQDGQHPQPLTDMGLSHILTRAKEKLHELNNLVLSCLIYPNTMSAVRPEKFKWLKERKRIKAAQSSLRDRKQDLTTLLGAYNLSGVSQLKMSIHQISVGIERVQTEQKESVIREKLAKQIVEQPKIATEEDNSQANPSPADLPGPETTSGLLSVIHEAELIRVQASFYRRMTCRLLCSCQCHQRRSIRTPMFTKRFIGSLFIGYSGLPFMAQECNEKLCRQRSESRVVVSYQFPKWFWTQAFFKATIATSASSGPEMLLRVQRTYPFASEIYQYCLDGDVMGLKRLFESRIISPYDVDLDGRSLIHNALRGKKSFLACQILITAGADVQQEDQFGSSAFHSAWDTVLLNPTSSKKNPKLLELFPLSEGGLDDRQFSRLHKIILGILSTPLRDELDISTATIDDGDNLGRTPLFWAASRGDFDAVSLLLQYGANPQIQCHSGSPLHAAASGGYADITHTLLDHGADVNARCSELTTPLMRASVGHDGNGCIAALLSHGADIDARDSALNFALLEACQNCMRENARVLLAHGPELDLTDHEGWTAMASSVFWKERGTTHCVKLLVEAGADYLLTTHAGDNILHNAAQYVGVSTILHLIECKLGRLDPNARNAAGMTPQDLADCRTDVDGEWRRAFRALLATTGIAEDGLRDGKMAAVRVEEKPITVRVIEVCYSDSEEEVFEDAMEEPI